MINNLTSGDVILYPYLWRRESDRGETEGRKVRPACLAITLEMKNKTFLYLLAITSKSPESGQQAIDIPALELRRIRLDAGTRSWLVVSEYNRDIVGESFYLNPQEPPLGRFSERFLVIIQKALRDNIRKSSALVKRSL